MTLIARSLCFLTQFISFQDPWFFDAISQNLSSKNTCFVFFTMFLKAFQSSNCLNVLYFASLIWHSLFYQALEYLVILMHFEYLYQMTSDLFTNSWTASLSKSLLLICSVLIFLMASIRLVINLSSSSLFLIIVHYLFWTNFSMMKMSTINGVWSDK